MSGVYAPSGSKYVTIVRIESTQGHGLYAPDGSIRITIVGTE